jgi:secreted trypsin-like serine protease
VAWTEPASGRDISCTGTLIARDLVLTAAHCLMDAKLASDIQVDLLTPSVQSFGLPQIHAKKFIVHENYVKRSDNRRDDLALILLEKPAPAEVPVAELVPASWTAEYFEIATVIGYGVSDDRPEMALSDDNGSGILRWTKLEGMIPLPPDGSGTAGMIAVPQKHTGICHGDSGGPLFVQDGLFGKPLLLGVTHSVIPSDDQEKSHLCLGYSYFVNLADQLDWISAQTAILRQGTVEQ